MIANAQMWGALFWLAIGAYVTWAGKDLGLGKLAEPGSGFALFWIGLIMCALAASELYKAVMKGGDNIASYWEGTRWEKVLLVTVMLLVFGFLFEFLGFIICSVVMLLVLMLFVDPVPPRRAITISVASTLLVWITLTEALKIQMPSGLLAGWPEDSLRGLFRGLTAMIKSVFN